MKYDMYSLFTAEGYGHTSQPACSLLLCPPRLCQVVAAGRALSLLCLPLPKSLSSPGVKGAFAWSCWNAFPTTFVGLVLCLDHALSVISPAICLLLFSTNLFLLPRCHRARLSKLLLLLLLLLPNNWLPQGPWCSPKDRSLLSPRAAPPVIVVEVLNEFDAEWEKIAYSVRAVECHDLMS